MLSEVKKSGGDAAVVVAMSGNYVQRGEPAVIDKFSRAEAALMSGADLVVEIPTLFCLGNGGQYAGAGVRLLEALCCDKIAFGSESADILLLEEMAEFLKSEKEALADKIAELTREGMNYPSARASAYASLRAPGCGDGANCESLDKELEILRNPNDILALEYLMSMNKAEALVIKREGAGYSDVYRSGAEFQSAAAIRNMLLKGEDVRDYLPESSAEILNRELRTFPDDWTELLRYAIINTEVESTEDAPSGGEGLGNLLKEAAKECDSFSDIIMHVKSKRYTYTRISRLCMQTLLGITRSEYPMKEPLYARVLGFGPKGREYLAELKKEEAAALPVITNINKEFELLSDEAAALLELDVKGSDIYNIASGRDARTCSDHRKMPVITSV